MMLVYWESMVWSIIANGVVYVKYKHVCKTKLMVLNSRLFPPSPFGYSHDTRLEVADGGNVICHCVSIAAMPLPTHISFIMLHYHRYSGLMYGSPVIHLVLGDTSPTFSSLLH